MKNSTAEERREFVGELIVGLVGAKGFDKLSKGSKIGDVIGGGKKLVNQTSKAILKNGYYEVNGFKFTKNTMKNYDLISQKAEEKLRV